MLLLLLHLAEGATFHFSAAVKEKESTEQLQTLLKSLSCKQQGREGLSWAKLTEAAVPPPQEGKRVMEGWKEEKGLAVTG